MRYGVIDIGSNSVKFLVVEKSGAATRVVTEQSHSTRLAEDLIATAELKPEAMARTLALFTRLRAEGEQLGVDKWMAVATSAVRDARNRKDFLKAAAEHLKFPVRLFSGEEEAETVFLGVTADHRLGQGDILVLDVGGGSSEWVQGKGGAIEKRVSLPLGCVRLRERFIDGYPVSPEKLAGMLQALQDQLQPILGTFQLGSRHLMGTGGTITATAALVLQLKKFDPEKVHLFAISLSTLEDQFRTLASLPLEQLVKVTGMPENRADIIVPGMAVFLVTMRLLGAREVRVSTRGLRYGILERLIAESEGGLEHFK
jgi:exopolyphosphatase/guanosine-5'-triphosphate,3'-diphosphate pyrophosphatase